MPLLGSSVLLIAHDFPDEDDREFNEWYIREHMPERVTGLPGFNRGRRFRVTDDGLKYLAFYEVTDAGALASDAYLALVRNFDPRSRQFVPRFQSAARTISTVRASAGFGEGGVVGLIGFAPGSAHEPRLRGDNAAEMVRDLASRPGIVGAHLLEADLAALEHSRKGHLRQQDMVLPWTLLIEAIDDDALGQVWQDSRAPGPATVFEMLRPCQILVRGRYRALFGITAATSLKPAE